MARRERRDDCHILCREDRQAWLDALAAAKKSWEGVPPEMASAMTDLTDSFVRDSPCAFRQAFHWHTERHYWAHLHSKRD